jgi:hypothetical protein
MKKEITRNRKEKRHKDIESTRKYRDKVWDKIEKRCKGYIFLNKEVDHEAIRKIIQCRERLKKNTEENIIIYKEIKSVISTRVYLQFQTRNGKKKFF